MVFWFDSGLIVGPVRFRPGKNDACITPVRKDHAHIGMFAALEGFSRTITGCTTAAPAPAEA
jgi:hypothetical protein